MNDISFFLEPIGEHLAEFYSSLKADQLGCHLKTYMLQQPDWLSADIIILGCREERGAGANEGTGEGPDQIRKQLYSLSLPGTDISIADIGNLKAKNTQEDFYEVLAYVVEILLKNNKTVILLGGSNDIAYAQYMGYENLDREIDYVHVDARLDLMDSEIFMDNQSFNHRIFKHQPSHLFNFANLGHQRYFVSQPSLKLIKDMNFQAIRYGDVFGSIEETEPYLRAADMLSIDLSSIKHADSPGTAGTSPGGFTAMEACRIARYAGLSHKLDTISICEYNPRFDIHDQSALLAAMMVWYFVEGYYSRRDDAPDKERKHLKKYAVKLHASVEEIVFYQHPLNGRWWMEVPFQDALNKTNKDNTVLIPCSERDYKKALDDDIPERWWLTYNKLK